VTAQWNLQELLREEVAAKIEECMAQLKLAMDELVKSAAVPRPCPDSGLVVAR
jgi:hypothetical protein